DTPDKVTGKAEFGIDVRLPGMKVATVAASPVLGGKVAGLDEAKAKAIPGVRQIVRLDDTVAVVADHMWAAKQGLAALAIRWDDGPNATVSTSDVVQELDAASKQPGVVAHKQGDAAAAIAGAAQKLEAVYQVPFLAHVTMEPMNCTVHVRKDGCEVWTGSQVLSRARATAAEVTGLPLEKVVVHNHLLGGGFGRRLEVDYVTQAVRIAKQVDAPVKVEHVRHEEPVLDTGFWRGVGVTHNNFVIESFTDELAAASRQDPVAFRRALLGKSPRGLAVLDLAATEGGWGKPLPRGHGRGVALLYSGWGTYLAQVADVEVTGSGDVRVHRLVCPEDCGRIVNPDIVTAQIQSGVVYGISGALWGEVTLKNGRVEQSNFHNYRVLRMNESPPIEVHLVRNSEAPGGIGEPGTAVTAPALGNAIYAATGKRLRKLPLQAGLRLVAR